MNSRLRRTIDAINSHRKSNHAWQRGVPFTQPYFDWQGAEWVVVDATIGQNQAPPGMAFSVLSWNIDFMRSFTEERMKVALDFLAEYIQKIERPGVVMLNEMLVSDLELIQKQPWIRGSYYLTDISSQFWESGYYGTCILVPKVLPILNLFRVHYQHTAMERDGLFVDVRMGSKSVRICSTHLESLVAEPPKRPSQLETAAKFMHEAQASILGGDLNAIQPFDKTLHLDNNLKDAYLENGGVEDDESGMTWGQMAATKERSQFGLSRMDKLLYCGAIELEHFETFGMDVQLDDGELAKRLIQDDDLEKPWVTDHLGVRGDFGVANPSPSL